jgi:hypothetical protein
MNVQKMYAVYDVKSGLYFSPHFLQSDGVAIRSFSTACEDTQTEFNKFPEDFSLFHIGSFNTENGEIIPEQPKQICTASEFVKKLTATEIADSAKTIRENIKE